MIRCFPLLCLRLRFLESLADAAAFSTHGYLHGTVAKLRLGFAELRRVLRRGAPIVITLGSIEDARFGLVRTAASECRSAQTTPDRAGRACLPADVWTRRRALPL